MSLSEEQVSLDQDSAISPETISHEEAPQNNSQGESSYKKAFDAFVAELESLPDAEAKLHKAIAFMEAALAQGGSPHFKSFWESRNLCVELFKQNMNPISRSLLWTKYSELSKEARRLKEILEEQSAFAAEQIDIAVSALEKEIESCKDSLSPVPELNFDGMPQSLEKDIAFYAQTQQELNLLNTYAARINALRKELIKTELRVKQKNKFFQRLSLAGDKVFPRRKELIKDISQHFSEAVDRFIATYFTQKQVQESLFFLREEIKALQGVAKLLTLNTHAFTHTRMRLSECWDSVKEADKERKKVRNQQKLTFKQNYDLLHAKIDALRQAFGDGQTPINEAQKKIDEIVAEMRQTELGRDELKMLRDEINEARRPIQEKIKAVEDEKQQQVVERENVRKKALQDVFQQCEDLVRRADSMEADAIGIERESLLSQICEGAFSKSEKLELEKRLKPLRDLIAEKKEKSLLSLSDDDRQLLQQLKVLLKEKRELRQETKAQIEHLRKAAHGSGLDFEQSRNFNAQLAMEKERLEKINVSMREIESKIEEIERLS